MRPTRYIHLNRAPRRPDTAFPAALHGNDRFLAAAMTFLDQIGAQHVDADVMRPLPLIRDQNTSVRWHAIAIRPACAVMRHLQVIRQ